MVRKYLTKNQSGFSLIELLITVVIIGVLAAMGVPQYRRMVSKSRQAEAKVMLGAIFTAESAFQAEYGSFGDNVIFAGVTITAPQNYVAGFTGAAAPACTNVAANGYLAVLTAPAPYQAGPSDRSGSLIGLPTAPAVPPAAPVYNNMCGGTVALNASSTIAVAAFRAFASGNIEAANIPCAANAAPGVRCDIWTINQAGVLANAVVGF
jgi:type IV pilus assembly protein PilA